MAVKKKGKIVNLHADERTDDGKKAIDNLLSKGIMFSTIPTSGRVPRVNFGVVKYDGLDEIDNFVKRIKKYYVLLNCEYFER